MATRILREWTHSPSTFDDSIANSPGEAPVIATLVTNNILYRKGNVLLQSAYDQLGQRFSSKGKNDGQIVKTIPSLDSWTCNDCPDEGEVHIINDEAVEVYSAVLDEDELYEEAIHNNRRKRQSFIGLRNPFRVLRGSKEKNKKKRNESVATPIFPVPIEQKMKSSIRKSKRNNHHQRGSTKSSQILCVRFENQQNNSHEIVSRAPKRQNMSRAALDFMSEPTIIPDREISDLDTSTDYSISDTLRTPPRHNPHGPCINEDSIIYSPDEVRFNEILSNTRTHLKSDSKEGIDDNVCDLPPKLKNYRAQIDHLNHSSQCQSLDDRQPDKETLGVCSLPHSSFDVFPKDIYNDTLKVVFLGSSGCGKSSIVDALTKNVQKRRKNSKSLDIDVVSWNSSSLDKNHSVNFNLWDLKGGHHSAQSVFFTSNSLYILVWKMSTLSDTYHETDYDSDNEFEDALRKEKRDHQIERDIDEHVIFWIELLSNSSINGCAVMPVVTFKDHLKLEDVDHRCKLLKQRLEKTACKPNSPKYIYDSNGSVPRLSSTINDGIIELEDSILDFVYARNSARSVFWHHFQRKIDSVITSVQNIISSYKNSGVRIIRVEDVIVKLAENPPTVQRFTQSLVLDALQFLSDTGIIIYFDAKLSTSSRHSALGKFIVLCPIWLSNAISLAFRWESIAKIVDRNKDTGISQFRNFLPILSNEECMQLWEQTEYVYKVNNTLSRSGSNGDFYSYLQQICEYSGVLVPFKMRITNGKNHYFYLIPMLAKEVPEGFWSYKVRDQWMTMLCNSFSFDNAMSSGSMDKLAAAILKTLFQVSSGSIKVQQVLYWKTAIYAKIIEEFKDSNDTRKSHSTEIYVHWARNDKNCVTVSAKGYEGLFGEKIWKLGYESVLALIEDIARDHVKGSVRRDILCPECLLEANMDKAHFWKRDEINSDDHTICCFYGHHVSPKLLIGSNEDVDDCASVTTGVTSVYSVYSSCTNMSYKQADSMIPAVVLVALWDKKSHRIVNIGSGFIADSKRGLIVTATHTLFDFDEDENKFGLKYSGLPDATVVIGVNQQGSDSALFTYCADVISFDLNNVDGCVLQIKSRFEQPVELDGNTLAPRAETPIWKQGALPRLRMTKKFSRQQEARILGYRQTGDNVEHINHIACVSVGYVCKPPQSTQHKKDDSFVARSEIVVHCPNGIGYSGGPFVNEQGEVIGILSRADPIDKNRCYLTASTELMRLLKEAKHLCGENNRPLNGNSYDNIYL